MKKITLSIMAALAVAGTTFAGTTVVSSKEYKQPVVAVPCFKDWETVIDGFYSYNDGIANRQHRYFRDGSGGGVDVTQFFYRYFGLGVEGNWWDGANTNLNNVYENGYYTRHGVAYYGHDGITYIRDGKVYKRDYRIGYKSNWNHHGTNRDTAQQFTGQLTFRYPLEMGGYCWAPYAFLGGGAVFDGRTSGLGDAGLGMEFRFNPHVGIFADWRYNWTDDHKNYLDQTRAGMRYVF